MRKLRPLLILLLIPLGSGTTHAQIRGEYQPDANTVLLLHMNETSGSTVTDASSYGNNGTATGTTIVDGRFGKGRSFSGTSDYIRVANNVFDPNFPFTCEAWVNIDQLGTRLTFLSLAGAPGAGGASVGLSVEANGRAQFSLFDGGGHTIFSKDSLELNRWYHIAGVYTTQRMRLYINGILQRDSTHSGGAQTWSNLYVGANAAYNADYFNGLIDEVRISNKARSASEFNLQLPPRNLTATVSGTTISLNWQNGGGTVGLLRYKVYRGLDSTNVSLIDSTAGATFSNTGIAFGTRYFYRVSAVDSTAFEGAKSFAVNATTASGSAVPTITSFSPTSGPIGTSVTITGTNFSPTPANNVVYFGPVRATVNSATSSSLTVTVPSGATYQPISVTVDGLTAHSRAPFIITFSGGGSIANGSFASKVDFTTAFAPYNIAIGDLDGDGKPDLAVTNYSSNTVSVFRNTSVSGVVTNESFSARVDFVTGSSPSGVVITDFDGDGKLDLAVTNSGSNTVSLFRNTSTTGGISNNSFSTKVDFETQAIPLGIATGDLDADGKPDLVVTNTGLHTISVFRNIGVSGSITTNSFEVGLVFFSGSTSGSNPYGVAMSDLDGDGKPDLAVTNQSSSSLSVFRNNSISGSIRFDAKVDFAAGTSPQYVAIGDLDGDGKPDLAITNNQSTTVSVFRNTSTGGSITSSSFSGKVDFTTGGYSFGVGIGDLDGDGKPDLAVTNYVGNSISVFRNTSSSGSITNNSFATKVDFATGSSPWGIAVGDLDGDGKTDLAVANYGSNTISVLRNGLSGLSSAALLGEYTADASTVLLLHMNETSGSPVSDASSFGNNGTVTGTTIVDGRFGKARSFNGSTDRISVPSSASLNVSPNLTLEVWLKPTGFSGVNTFLRKNGPNSQNGYLMHFKDNGTAFDFGINTKVGVGTNTQVTPAYFLDGKWHHIAATYDGAIARVYFDGVLVDQDTFNETIGTNSSDPVSVGANDVYGEYFQGLMDEVRISNKARLPSEFNLQLPPKNITATASGTTINLSWQNGEGAVGLLRYKIYRGTDSTSVSIIDSTASTSYSNSGLVAGTRYFYRISAVDSTGFEGARSYAATAVVTAVPTITSFSPTSGPIGTTVTITGTNFSMTAANNIVHFAAVRGTVTAAASTSLNVTVPAGATYAPIAVTVNGLTAYTNAPFVLTFPSNRIIDKGSFAAKVDYATNANPQTFSNADLDGDGKIDLISANFSNNSVSILRNTSSAGSIVSSSFATKVDVQVGANPLAVCAEDLDGDGKKEILTTLYISGQISVLTNRSSVGNIDAASFASPLTFPVGVQPVYIQGFDLDSDGRPEVVVANQASGTISISKDTSSIKALSSSSFAKRIDYSVPGNPQNVTITDIDGDGKPDIVASSGVQTKITVLLNKTLQGQISDNSFTLFAIEVGRVSRFLAVGDLNGDGKPDVVVANGNSNSVSVFQNNSVSGGPSFGPAIVLTTAGTTNVTRLADIDGDGLPDILVGSVSGGQDSVLVFRNLGQPTLSLQSFAQSVAFFVGGGVYDLGIADIDGDSKPDVLALSPSGIISILRNTVSTATPSIALSTSSISFGVVNVGSISQRSITVSNTGTATLAVSSVSSTNAAFSASPSSFTVTPGVSQTVIITFLPTSIGSYSATINIFHNASGSLSTISVSGTGGGASAATFTDSVSNVTASSAVLWGSTNPFGASTRAWFEWGRLSPRDTSVTAQRIVGSGNAMVVFSDTIWGLLPNSGYYFRVLSENETGLSKGIERQFTTSSSGTSPIVFTLGATSISSTSVTLNGSVNPNGLSTTVTFQYGTTTSYGLTATATQSPVSGTKEVAVSAPVTGLSSNTTYNFRVVGSNSGGTSNGGNQSFTTVVAAPVAPTLASPPNSASGVSTSPTMTWSSVSGATSYRLQVSTSSGFSTLVLDQSGVNANSYSLSSLANNTTYYWRVSASNVGGTSAFASTFSFTTIVAAPAAVTVGSPANGATNQPTTLTLSWSGSAGATTYRVQVATDPTLRSLVVHDSLLTTTSRQVGPLAYNTVYYWQVSARNAGGESPFSPSASFTTVASKTISPSTPITFPINPTSSTDYRLISFPGTSSLTVGQVFTSGSQNTDWRIFRENGNALPSNLTELSSSSALAVGEGYWVLQKGTLSFSRSVTMPQVSSDGTYTINVRNGWNVIGNPFDVDVQWSSVLSANSLSGITLSAYNGSQGFQSVTVFEPFKGYYCNVPLTTLKIRYPFPAFNVLPLESPPIDWKLRFALETDINKDEENYIGIALSAKIDLDELDQPKPPLVFDQGFLYFPRATWSDRYSLYNSDFRPGVGEGQVWDFEVSNPRRTRSIIRVLGVESVPPAYEITLVNLHNTAAVDLRKRNEYEFLPVKDKTPFQVIVGKRSYTDQELAKFIPSSFELEQNYPNPFNPTTSIGYKVAKESLVKVEILSLLGQTVAILINARHSPGVYTLVWNASDQGGAKVPSGVYLSRLIVDGKVVQVRKMTLLR